jgi:hypothetical protein
MRNGECDIDNPQFDYWLSVIGYRLFRLPIDPCCLLFIVDYPVNLPSDYL